MDPPSPAASATLDWRGRFDDDELNRLHAECFGHAPASDEWWSRVNRFSLGWVCLRMSGRLAGFVNVAWDGGAHAFLLDTMVASPFRHGGWATRMVARALGEARSHGREWLHVDFEPRLGAFYFQACGFVPTDAGLIALKPAPDART